MSTSEQNAVCLMSDFNKRGSSRMTHYPTVNGRNDFSKHEVNVRCVWGADGQQLLRHSVEGFVLKTDDYKMGFNYDKQQESRIRFLWVHKSLYSNIKRYWKKLTCDWTVFSKKWIYFFHIVLYFLLSYNNKNNSVD